MLAIHLLTIWTILASVFLAFFSLLYRESEMNLTSNIRIYIYIYILFLHFPILDILVRQQPISR